MDSLPGRLPAKTAGLDTQVRKAQVRKLLFKKRSPLPKIDRFTLLDLIGVGGTSEVYAAYDDRLDRKVAIKLVRGGDDTDGRAGDRLIREAQTLARLSHPNVVQVYDAGRYEDRVYLAIEFIRGRALPEWLAGLDAASQRDRQRAVLRQLIAAGRGVQAAHQAGLTHRDIKPRNIVVGRDERARVLDFGLASDGAGQDSPPVVPRRGIDDSVPSGLHPSIAPDYDLTPVGSVMGTPAYMAPELFLDAEASKRSDQFSFCVTAYEALCGERPYLATSVEALDDGSLDAAALAAKSRTRELPAPIRKALLRGLSAEPADRYANMGQLLGALESWPTRRYWTGLLVAVALVAIGVVGAVALRSPGERQGPVCQGAEQALAEVWNDGRRGQLEQALLGTEKSFAGETWQLLERDLDGYAGTWVTMHRDGCLAHRDGGLSDTMYDRRVACLDRRRTALDAALTVLAEVDGASLDRAADSIQALPPVSHCGNTEALMADVPPPDRPEVASRVIELRELLDRARALYSAGRYAEAGELAETVAADAGPLDYPAVLAEARLIEARAIIDSENMSRRSRAMVPLGEAVRAGFEAGDHARAVEAFARLVYARSTLDKVNPAAIDFASALLPLAEKLPNGAAAHAVLHLSLGVAHRTLEQTEQARENFARALEIAEREELALARVARQNLVKETSDADERLRLLDTTWRQLTGTYRRGHPRRVAHRLHAATYTDDPQLAFDTLAPACAAYAKAEYDNGDGLTRCLLLLGFLAAELGDPAAGARHLRSLPAAAADVDEYRLNRVVARAFADLYTGEPERALSALEAESAGLSAEPESWWVLADQAELYLGIGVSARALGRHERAVAALERALPMYQRLSSRQVSSGYGHRLAWTRTELARSLLALNAGRSGPDSSVRARVMALCDAAEAWYLRARHERRLRELRAWRRDSGL